MTERPRKRRMQLTLQSKQEICQRKQANPNLTLDELAEKYGCDRSTVSKILKTKTEWLSMQLTQSQAKTKVNQSVKFEELETSLAIWTQQVLLQNAILTDELMQLQAKKFARLLNISENDFKASNGWLNKFKKQHGIR